MVEGYVAAVVGVIIFVVVICVSVVVGGVLVTLYPYFFRMLVFVVVTYVVVCIRIVFMLQGWCGLEYFGFDL